MEAIDGIAVENPLIYVYEIDSNEEPKFFKSYDMSNLTFFENDSLSNLPGSYIENSNIIVPEFQLIQPLDRWSDMMDGIRFRLDNATKIYPAAVPAIEPFANLIYNADVITFDSLEIAQWFYVDNISLELSYTNYASYVRRLNFDYEIEFFSEAWVIQFQLVLAQWGYLSGLQIRILVKKLGSHVLIQVQITTRLRAQKMGRVT